MTPTPQALAAAQRVHRALSSPVRARVLDELRGEPDLDAATLAERLGLHVNTVRAHLAVLEEARLVAPTVEQRDRPGRPRRLYRVVADAPGPAGLTGDTGPTGDADPTGDAVPTGDADERDDGYRFLATILASYLGSTSAEPSVEAERAGRAWGAFVTDRPAPFSSLPPAEVVERLRGMLDTFGFAPTVEDAGTDTPRLVLGRCPFLDVAREHQDVVCAVHLGLMRGAVEQLGADVEVLDLLPWARPDACVSHLEVAAR